MRGWPSTSATMLMPNTFCIWVLEQVVQHHLGHFAAAQFDDHAHAVLVGPVAQLADAFELLCPDQFGDLLDQSRLVDLVRQLGDHDALPPLSMSSIEVRGADIDLAAPGAVRRARRRTPLMIAAVGKSGPGTISIRSSIPDAGCRSGQQASITSVRLCGGMLVAMPTAMPEEPLTSRFGNPRRQDRWLLSDSS